MSAEAWPPESDAVADATETEAVANVSEADAVAEAPETEAFVETVADAPMTDAVSDAPEMRAFDGAPAADQFVTDAAETPAAETPAVDAAWDAAPSSWDTTVTEAWAGTVPWDADAPSLNGHDPEAHFDEPVEALAEARASEVTEDSAEPYETVVEETTDEPSATAAEWSAQEVAGVPETAVAEAVAELDDAPWKTAAEAVTVEQVDEPTEAMAEVAATDTEWRPAEAVAEMTVEQSDETSPEAVAEAAAENSEWTPVDVVAETSVEDSDPSLGEAVVEATAEESDESPADAVAEYATTEPDTEPAEAVAEYATTTDVGDEPVEAVVEAVSESWQWTSVTAVVDATAQESDEVSVEAVAEYATTNAEDQPSAAVAGATADESDEATVEAVAQPTHDEWGSPWDAPVAEAVADDQPADDQPVVMATSELESEPESEPVAVAIADASEDDYVTDSFVAGQAPWDLPEPFTFDDETAVDDRPTDYFVSYDDMFPVVAAAVAAATDAPAADQTAFASAEEPTSQDPDDAFAPVLNDVEQSAAPNWTIWQPPVDSVDGRMLNQPAFRGKIVGPTPPDDLFGEPSPAAVRYSEPGSTVEQTIAFAAGSGAGYEVSAEVGQALSRQLPALYSTGPANPQQPLVVRIELTIVDETNKLRSAEMARRVGPWSDGDADADSLTPRHPEFEPRTQLATADETDATDETKPEAAVTAQAPMPAKAEASPVPQPQEPVAHDPWNMQPTDASPDGFYWVPAVTESPSSPVLQTRPQPVDVPWAIPALEQRSDDPLSSLPAATFGAQAAQPTYQGPAMAFDSETPVKSVASNAAPASASQAAAVAASTTRPVAKGDQADLWFLASEPEGYVADQAGEAQATQSSTLLTAGLTITMAVVVIILVLVFIQLMTSLLK